MRQIRQYDATFRREAVALVVRSNHDIEGTARSLGIPRITLRNWYNQDVKKKKSIGARPRKGKPAEIPEGESDEEKITRLERRVATLEKEKAQLEMDRAILKKAAAFFVKEST